MTIDRRELKKQAGLAVRQAKPHPALVTLMTVAITAVLTGFTVYISGLYTTVAGMVEAALATGVLIEPELPELSMAASLLVLALELLTMVISVGYSLYALRVWRREKASFGDVFDAFGLFLRAVWLSLLQNLIVSFLASVYEQTVLYTIELTGSAVAALLYLPLLGLPLAAMYFYRLAVFVMLDHPEYRVFQCLAVSRMATLRRIGQLIRLDLSMLGWYLLYLVPFGVFFARPRITVTTAGFYEAIMPDFEQWMKQRAERAEARLRGETPPRGDAGERGSEDAPPTDYHIPGESRDDWPER